SSKADWPRPQVQLCACPAANHRMPVSSVGHSATRPMDRPPCVLGLLDFRRPFTNELPDGATMRFRLQAAGNKRFAMRAGAYPELLRLPVTMNGIELGRTVEVLVDRDGRVVGFELACRDGRRQFLPVSAANVR